MIDVFGAAIRPRLLASIGLLALWLIAPGRALGQAIPTELKTADYRVKVEVVTRDAASPWAIAFVDARTAFVTEKGGKLRMLVDGKLSAPIRDVPTSVDVGQGGMLDVSVDPNYATEPWIYLGYTHAQGDSADRKSRTMTRIVRGKVVDGAWTDQQVLFEAKPEHYREGGVHFGNRIVFDRQGLMYFAIGDRGAMQHAQELGLPNGKVHRLHRDGRVPEDNPFVGKDDAYPSIYSYGNRNPQGLAFHPETDQLWSTEHGPRGGDELNLIEPGRNYGWPVITYGINYNGKPITDKTEMEGMEQPAHQWTPSIAVCGLDFYRGQEFPKWENQLLVGALNFKEVRRVKVEGEAFVEEEIVLKDIARVRDVQTAPDGSIYVVLERPDLILRLTNAD